MYNKHIDSFLSIADTGSFAKAAEAIHISRTALIQQINLLEEHIGFSLFIRSSKGVSLTPMGILFAKRAREIQKISADTLADCRTLQNTKQIRIGVLPNLPLNILGPICTAYYKQYPDTKIIFVERSSSEYLSAFLNNEFDISADYMSHLVTDNEGICFAKLATDSFNCAVPPNHKLSGLEKISLNDLKGQEVALLIAGLAQAEDNLRNHLKKAAPEIKIIDIESFGKSLPLTCLLENRCLLHYSVTQKEYEPLISIPLETEKACPIELGLCYKTNASKEVRSFINFAEIYCKDNISNE